jgi:xylulokinase
MSYVIGLDIGTTSTIGILLAMPDRVLARASRPVTLSSPRPGWAEEDPQVWWRNVCAIVPALLEDAGLPAQAIAAIGVTGMLPALVLLDRRGRLLRPAIQQSDARCGAEVEELKAEIDESTFVQRTGNGINQQLIAARTRWLARHEPETFAQVHTAFGSYDYINWRLTGERAVEQNWALEAGFVDLAEDQITDDLVALSRLPRSTVPRRVRSSDLLGTISAEAAAATGLAIGTPVIGGAADHIASAYAAGIRKPGDVLLKFGGSADILIATTQARPDPRLFLDHHLIPGLWMPNGCMASGGTTLNWFVERIACVQAEVAAKAGESPHVSLDRLATDTPPGAEGVFALPHFLGEKTPIHDALARGAFLGMSLSHGIPHLWRALLEGFAFAFRHHVAVLEETGQPATRFLASDGGSQSDLWLAICADVLGVPVQRLDGHPGSCLGAAWVAALGAGLTDDWDGVEAFVSQGRSFEPCAAHAETYDAGYERYLATYEALAGLRDQ